MELKELMQLPKGSRLDVTVSYEFGGWEEIARQIYAEAERLTGENMKLVQIIKEASEQARNSDFNYDADAIDQALAEAVRG